MPNKVVDGLRYRGQEGQWSWILHRITGIGVLVFLFIHIFETSLLGFGPETYDKALAVYHTWYFRIGEVILGACVLYHALNGVRICIIDFWEESTRYHRQLFWIEIVLFFIVLIPSAYIMLKPIFHF